MEVQSQPYSAKAVDSGSNNLNCWYTRLKTLLQNQIWVEEFAGKIDRREMHPLEFIEFCQADLSASQGLYKIDLDQLKGEAPENICGSGEPAIAGDQTKPLNLPEKEQLKNDIYDMPAEHIPDMLQIMGRSLNDDEIDLNIDQLNAATQRKLLHYVSKMSKVRCPLTVREWNALSDYMDNNLPIEEMDGVTQIFRESAGLEWEGENTFWVIDQLNAVTQRKLLRHLSKVRYPLTLREQETITETINNLPPEDIPGVNEITGIHTSALLDGDADEIDLDVEQLDTFTQRKLLRYSLPNLKKSNPGSLCAAFEGKDDSDAESDGDEPPKQNHSTTPSGGKQGQLVGAVLHSAKAKSDLVASNSLSPGEQKAIENNIKSSNWYNRLETLLRNEGWIEIFANKLLCHEIQPLDFAVFSQAELSTIEEMYKMDPQQLKVGTLFDACFFGAQPGVIAFLATEKPELYSSKGPNLINLAMNEGPGQTKAAESDVKSLVQLWPASLAMESEFYWVDEDGNDINAQSTALHRCLRQGYSKDLLEFMLNHFPDKIPKLTIHRWSVDLNDMIWIQRVLPKIHGELFCDFRDWKDQDQVLVDFLRSLFLEENFITTIKFFLPNFGATLDPTKVLPMLESLPKMVAMQQQGSRIERLSIEFGHTSNNFDFWGILNCLPYFPCLRDLEVCIPRGLEQSLPALCHLLNTGKLEQLIICANPSELLSNPSDFLTRKRKAPCDESLLPLHPLFDALIKNSTLAKLRLRYGYRVLSPYDLHRMTPYRDKLLEVLKENKTLQDIDGIPGGSYRLDKLTYYLHLNKCGRKRAEDATALLAEFVEMLDSVESRLAEDKEYTGSVQYGLLLEAVGKWAS